MACHSRDITINLGWGLKVPTANQANQTFLQLGLFLSGESCYMSLCGRDRDGVLYGYLTSPGRVGTAFSTPNFSHLSVKVLA